MWIDRLARRLLPRPDPFFPLLAQIGDRMTEAAAVFARLEAASGHKEFDAVAARLKSIETEADRLCQRVYAELDRTFVTPIDRDDLARLARALDDVVDGMEHAAAFAALFRFEALTEPMRRMVRITTRAVDVLSREVANLGSWTDPSSISRSAVALHTLENEADAVYRGAIEALFADGVAAKEVVRQTDMLFTLENGVDCCEDAMDVIRSVAVKNG